MRSILSTLTLIVLGSTPAFASNHWKNIEISGAGGVSWLNTEDTHLKISAYETDKNTVNSTSVDGAWKFGLGYYLFDEALKHRSYFNHMLLELNVYQTSSTIKGEVWQYELPQFNNYDYKAPLKSTRLMLDFKPSLITWGRFTPYLIVGVGAAWNKLSYNESSDDSGTSPSSALSLSDHTEAQLAWDLGAGFNLTLTEQLNLSVEYIYAFMGDSEPGSYSDSGIEISSPPVFSTQMQTVLLGLNYRFAK